MRPRERRAREEEERTGGRACRVWKPCRRKDWFQGSQGIVCEIEKDKNRSASMLLKFYERQRQSRSTLPKASDQKTNGDLLLPLLLILFSFLLGAEGDLRLVIDL